MRAMTRKSLPPKVRAARIYGVQAYEKIPRAFGIDNAKQLPIEDAVRYFVPPKDFVSLFIPKNHILLGSRGSGKTTWVRMMAHDHVTLAARDPSGRMNYAREALKRHLIGIYVPASSAFTGDLRNKPWQSEAEAEEYFIWRLNLHSCAALTHVIGSCIEQYARSDQLRPQLQADICRALSRVWTDGREEFTTYEGLRLALSGLELEHQAAIRRFRTAQVSLPIPTDHFHTDLFLPLRHAIRVMRTCLEIPMGAVWMLCLDEVEYLSEAHHRILNTQLRSASEDLVFKIATMPFAHHTLATNLADPIREGHDFEYIYVDREPIDSRGTHTEGDFLSFARHIFSRRMSSRTDGVRGLTLATLLGPSELLDEKRGDSRQEMDRFMDLLRRHANSLTVSRAERLFGSAKFNNEIYRKLHGALVLREALQLASHGNSKLRIYSGELLVVRCCDGNPRRLMRLINLLLQKLEFTEDGKPILPIDTGVQNDVLESLARDTLTRTQSEPPNGELTLDYLKAIGRFMRWSFISRRVGTDQVSSVQVTQEDGPNAQRFIKQAIQLSLMIPGKDVPIKTPDYTCVGDFHLSFLFAPLFKLLPRRNRAVRLSRVLAHSEDMGRGPRVNVMQASLLDLE